MCDAATGFSTADKGATDKSAADRLYFDDYKYKHDIDMKMREILLSKDG